MAIKKDVKYIPVQLFVRITRREDEWRECAALVARDDTGKEYVFCYEDISEDLQDLVVCDLIHDE